MENKKTKLISLKSISAVVVSGLLVLLFLSRTIYSYNLPKVSAVMPTRDVLNNIELTTGIVKYADITELYAKVGGTVGELYVKEGDAVTKGQPVMTMDFTRAVKDVNSQIDTVSREAESSLRDLQISREKIQLDMETTQTNISNTKRKIAELKQEVYKRENVSDFELVQCENNITHAEEDLANAQILFDAGAITEHDLTAAENNLLDLQMKRDDLRRAMDEATEQSADAFNAKEAERQKQIQDYEYQLKTDEQSLQSKSLDLDANSAQDSALRSETEAQTADLRGKIAEYEQNAVLYAPEDSFISAVAVNAGQYIDANQPLLSFGSKQAFIAECDVNLDNHFIVPGDTCELDNSAHSLDGVVTAVTPDADSKKVTVSIASDEATAGETFNIRFEKQSEESYTLVPSGAVGMDGDGFFLNQIKRRDGILGKEFYIQKLRVLIGDSDSENTVIVKGMNFFEPVALISDKPFSEGETIQLQNEGDFFEK